MTLGVAYCLSLLILIFFFGFMGYLSNWRTFVVQWGSLLLSLFVAATAVYATINHWQPPYICGVPTNWQLASWVALSLLTTAVYWYDLRTVATEDVPGISNWVIALVTLLGGWAGAFFSELFIIRTPTSFSNWVLLSFGTLLNIAFWVWLMDQMAF